MLRLCFGPVSVSLILLTQRVFASCLCFIIFQVVTLRAAEPTNLSSGPGAAEPSSPAEWYGLGVRPTEKQSPEQERAGFHLPAGFEIDLIAAEPQIAKPLNIAFDDRGRIWLTETVEYPYPAKADQPARDRVKVLEDRDDDGQFETITTFADNLNIPIGILPYGDGAIVFSIPNLFYLRDTDRDGRCDQRDVLLGPFDTSRDTHGMVNALRQGPDGWIYACHGFSNQSIVAGRDGHQVHLTSGNTFRFRPDGSRVEQYTSGQVNPFGMTEDRWGVLYSADCHSKPLTCLVRNACYPSFGRPDDGLGFFPSMMEHLHESTAISGICLYDADQFPPEYRQQFYSGNVMTSRINRDERIQQGATMIAKQTTDFLTSDDPWFRPVDIRLGPDGALYVADFYNRIIGHYEVPLDHAGRDRDSGRIWRIRYRKPLAAPTPLPLSDRTHRLDTSEYLRELGSENATRRRFALLQLQQIAANEPSQIKSLLESHWSDATPVAKSNLVWLAGLTELQSASMMFDALKDAEAVVRQQALAATTATFEQSHTVPADNLLQEARMLLADPDPMVGAAAAELLAVAGSNQDASALVAAIQRANADNMLKARLRIALRDRLQQHTDLLGWFNQLSNEEREIILDVLPGTKLPAAASILTERITSLAPASPKFTQWVQYISKYADAPTFLRLIENLRQRPDQNLQSQVELLATLKNAAGDRRMNALASWADDLQLQLIASIKASLASDQSSLSWSDEGGSVWTLEERKLNPSQQQGAAQLLLRSSFPLGESYRGVLRSQSFITGARLTFWLAGHNGIPGQPDTGLNRIRLMDATSGKVLQDTVPPRSDIAQQILWDTTTWQGSPVQVELIDGDQNAAYAWIAAGGFSEARLNPSGLDATWKSLLSLLQEYKSTHHFDELKPLLIDARLGIGRQLQLLSVAAQIGKHPPVQAVAFSMQNKAGNPAATEFIRLAASAVLDRPEVPLTAEFEQFCWDELQRQSVAMPQATQVALARKLAMNRDTATPLLNAIESGWITRDCLRDKELDAALGNVLTGDDRERLNRLKSSLSESVQEHTELREDVAQLFRDTSADVMHGKQVFEKACAVCHQVKGTGALVGPQLDGVGGRGVERLLEDILLPDRNVDKSFRSTAYLMADGTVLVGLFKSQDDTQIHAVDNAGKAIVIPLESIESQMTGDRSLMPDGFAQSLDAASLRDLIAYLQSVSGPAKPLVD